MLGTNGNGPTHRRPRPAHHPPRGRRREFSLRARRGARSEGHHVVTVPGGAAALALLDKAAKGRARPPDLFVLDLLMPSMSGIEVLQALRKSRRWASLPVLLVTGVNDPKLPVRLDVPIAFKPDALSVLAAVRQQLNSHEINEPRRGKDDRLDAKGAGIKRCRYPGTRRGQS